MDNQVGKDNMKNKKLSRRKIKAITIASPFETDIEKANCIGLVLILADQEKLKIADCILIHIKKKEVIKNGQHNR